MDFVNGLTLLLLYELAGEVSVLLLKVPVPGPVIGMLMLFITLQIKGKAPTSVSYVSNALLSHLSLLFVPAGVGIMVHFNRIAQEWLPISLSLILSTVMTMAVTAIAMQASIRILSAKKNHRT
ncbi:MAG: CidA/LrgA family protein [Phormidesmis sp.]